MEAPPAPGAGPSRARDSKRDRIGGARLEAGRPGASGPKGTGSGCPPPKGSALAYRYVKIGSPMSIQLKIDAAFGIGTRRHPWLAG